MSEWGHFLRHSMSEEERRSTRPEAEGRAEVRVVDEGVDDARVEEPEGKLEKDSGGEEVVRLEQAPVERREPASGPAPADFAKRRVELEEFASPDADLGEGDRTGLTKLTLVMAFVAVLLVVLGVAAVLVIHGSDEGSGTESFGVVEDSDFGFEEPEEAKYSDAELEELGRMAADLTVEYGKVGSVEEALPFIWRGEELREVLDERWEPLNLKVGDEVKLSGQISELQNELIVSVEAREGGRTEFVLVFRSLDDGLKLDWEASTGLGDVRFDELSEVPVGESVRMRVLVASSNFHPVEYPDDEFRSYRLWLGSDGPSVFGYARHGSAPVQRLAEIMNEGATLVSKVRRAGAIVILENAGRGESGQFMITKVLQAGWIEGRVDE